MADWGLVKKRVIHTISILSSTDDEDCRQRADALEDCLRLAEEVARSREVSAELRNRLYRVEQQAAGMRGALEEAERRFCRCDARRGVLCGIHALVQRALGE